MKRYLILILLFAQLLMLKATLFAQEVRPFTQVLEMSGIKARELAKIAPHFPDLKSTSEESVAVQAWIDQYPEEWGAFKNHPQIKSLNIAWVTTGINPPVEPPVFKNAWWDWFVASSISERKANQLFPHFPRPDLSNPDVQKEEADYALRLGVWMRLYPKEYERFVNTPELTSLNPYYKEYVKIDARPKFLGSDIGSEMPVLESTGNPVLDEYEYELKLRNWYFTFQPEEFEKRYGDDYEFDADFDAELYRQNTKEYILYKEGKKERNTVRE